MINDQARPPDGGLSLEKARERFCNSEKLERYQSLGAAIGWNTRCVISKLGGLTAAERERGRKVSEFEAARADVISDFQSKLRSGELLAWAREGSPVGPWKEIPADSWSAPWSFNWRNSIVKGPEEMKLYSLRIYRIGILDSPEWREGVTPNRAAQILAPEAYADFKATYIPLIVIGDPESEGRRDRADAAGEKIMQALNTPLKDGQLELRQLYPPNEPGAKWTEISRDVLMAKGLQHFWDPGELVCEPVGDKRALVRIFKPDYSPAPAEMAKQAGNIGTNDGLPVQQSDQNLAPPKGKRGPKPKWDWESATRELMGLANSPDGLPEPQARIEDHIAEWFLDNFDEQPSESMIRKFVADRLPPDY